MTLVDWPKNPFNNFHIKNCLFGAAGVVINSDKEKWIYSGYGIIFDGTGSWSIDNVFSRNVVIFGVDNS